MGGNQKAFAFQKGLGVVRFVLFSAAYHGRGAGGKIPFLRNLAWAMGYTPEETQDISLLKALLSWNEHAKIMRGELPDPDAANVFGNDGGFSSARQRLESERNSNLINLRAVNASLAQQGQAADRLAGSFYSVDIGEGARGPDVRIRKGNASANTQANEAKPGEVYFGADASAVARDPKDGFNTTSSLKKIANPNIAGGGSTDWLGGLVDKATRADAGLEGIAKSLETGGTLAQLAPVTDIGRHKAQRDMYYAWLTGMSARRTPQLVLKKRWPRPGLTARKCPKSV